MDLVLRGINLLAPVNLPGVLLTLPDQVRKFVHQANTTTPLPGLVSILPLTQLTAEAVTSGTVPAASHHQDPDQHALILQEVVRGLVLGMIIPAAVAKPQPLAVATILPAHTSMVAHQGITGMDQNVKQAVMKAQVGQILPPEPKPGVSLPQVAVALTLIGITAAVTVEAQALILEAAVPRQAINARA